jgi:hypothetical protein
LNTFCQARKRALFIADTALLDYDTAHARPGALRLLDEALARDDLFVALVSSEVSGEMDILANAAVWERPTRNRNRKMKRHVTKSHQLLLRLLSSDLVDVYTIRYTVYGVNGVQVCCTSYQLECLRKFARIRLSADVGLNVSRCLVAYC